MCQSQEVLIDVPSMPDSLYFPIVTISNGTIKPSEKDKRKFLIVPQGANTILSVSNQFPNGKTQILGQVELKVLEPPAPSFRVTVNNNPYKSNMEVKKGTQIKIAIQPDYEFSQMLPKDARYVIEEITIFLQQGVNPPQKIKSHIFDIHKSKLSYEIPLPIECFDLPNSKIYVEFRQSGRINAMGKFIEDMRVSPYEQTLILNVK